LLPWKFPGEFFIAIFFKKMGKILIKKSQIKNSLKPIIKTVEEMPFAMLSGAV